MEKRPGARAQAIDIRRLVLALAAVLAAAAVWAGVSLASGSGDPQPPGGNAPAQSERDGGFSFSQDGSNSRDGRDCPDKDGGPEPPSSGDAADASV
jgi:hypothetical protein